MSDPAWYSRLSRAGRDRVDQTLHVLACWALATVGTAAAAWLWAHRREFYGQWPPRTDTLPVLWVGSVIQGAYKISTDSTSGWDEYLPGARVRDTRRDLDWMLYGAIAGQVTQIGIVVGLAVWLS